MSQGTVTIMRGLPGSGKTKWAWDNILSKHERNSRHCSADNFFYVERPLLTKLATTAGVPPGIAPSVGALPRMEKVYEYDPKRQGEAHQACLADFLQAVRDGCPYIVVDNTGSKLWEYENYVAIAKMFDYDVEIVEMICMSKGVLREWLDRQQHNVPRAVVLEMWFRWEKDDRAKEVYP